MIDQSHVNITAVVTDDRVLAVQRGCPKNFVYGFWQIKEVIKKFSPDYILFLVPFRAPIEFFTREFKKMNYPLNKICDLSMYHSDEALHLESRINRVRKNPDRYKIFSTGISYSRTGIDPDSFELPLISFADSSQDLYYDYQIAKRLLNELPPPV